MTLHKKQQGFTIVELLIVIVVIGILAAIVLNTFSGVQQRARNTTREADISALKSQLEVYYADNATYPSLAQLNDATFRENNMPGLDSDALNDPGNDETAETLVATPAPNEYAYQPLAEDGSACNPAADPAVLCTQYTLTATYEGTVDGESTFVEEDLN